MNIMILGAGAMGMLFGGMLSQHNRVWLCDVDAARVQRINEAGVRITEKDGTVNTFRPAAVTDTKDLPKMDLVVVFVKAMFTTDALQKNQHLIGEDTYLMTLQNGAGHESKLLAFADRDHVIIGSTQHNSSVVENGTIRHGGSGISSIGLLNGRSEVLQPIADSFTACGFDCVVSNQVRQQIWKKLFTNTAASALTAILQVPLDFITADPHAHALMKALCREAVTVAQADGLTFDEGEVIRDVEAVCDNAKGGFTSIYADIQAGRRTEVDTISGSVVEAAHRLGVPVPYHEMVVHLIHAMENRPRA